jgi:hypothetical protein
MRRFAALVLPSGIIEISLFEKEVRAMHHSYFPGRIPVSIITDAKSKSGAKLHLSRDVPLWVTRREDFHSRP